MDGPIVYILINLHELSFIIIYSDGQKSVFYGINLTHSLIAAGNKLFL